MPYIYAQAKDSSERGLPMLRALFVEYPDDPGSWLVEDQYLLGSDILVAPLMEEGTTGRDVYLPPGEWVDYQTGTDLRRRLARHRGRRDPGGHAGARRRGDPAHRPGPVDGGHGLVGARARDLRPGGEGGPGAGVPAVGRRPPRGRPGEDRRAPSPSSTTPWRAGRSCPCDPRAWQRGRLIPVAERTVRPFAQRREPSPGHLVVRIDSSRASYMRMAVPRSPREHKAPPSDGPRPCSQFRAQSMTWVILHPGLQGHRPPPCRRRSGRASRRSRRPRRRRTGGSPRSSSGPGTTGRGYSVLPSSSPLSDRRAHRAGLPRPLGPGPCPGSGSRS